MAAARSFVLLGNPAAGRGTGTKVVAQAAARLRSRGHGVVELVGRDAADTTDLTRRAVVGGDGPSFGGGLCIAAGALLDDRLVRGTHVDAPSFRRIRVRRVRVESPGPTAYADGERIGPLPLDVEVVPGSLRVLTGDAS